MAVGGINHFFSVLFAAEDPDHGSGPGLLHAHGYRIDIQRTRLKKPLHRKTDAFRRHIIEVAAQLHDHVAFTDRLRQQIAEGLTEEQIRESWQEALANYKKIREKYVLYSTFASSSKGL